MVQGVRHVGTAMRAMLVAGLFAACQRAPATTTSGLASVDGVAEPTGPEQGAPAGPATPARWTPGIDGSAVLLEVEALAFTADSGLLPYSEDGWVTAYASSITYWQGRRPVSEQRVSGMFQLERSADGTRLITDTHVVELASGKIAPTLDLAKTTIASKGARLERVTADPNLTQALVAFDASTPPGLPWYIVDLETGATRATLPASKDRGPAPIVAWGEQTIAVGRYPSQDEVTVLSSTDFSKVAAVGLPAYASIFAVDQRRERLAVSDPTGVIAILDLANGSELRRMSLPESVYAMAFHPTLDLLAVSGPSGLRLVTIDPEPKVVASVPRSADSLAFDAQGRLFASLRTISIYELTTEEGAAKLADASSVAPKPWRPGGGDPQLARSFALTPSDELPVYATRLAIAADGDVFTSTGGSATLWRNGTPRTEYQIQARHVLRLADDGHLQGDTEAARLSDANVDPAATQWLRVPERYARNLGLEAAHVSPDGEHAVAIAKWVPLNCGDCEVRAPDGADDWSLVAAHDGHVLAEGEGAPLERDQVAWTKTRVAIAAGERGVDVRSLRDGRSLQTLTAAPPCSVYARGEDFVTVGHNGEVVVWDEGPGGADTWTRRDQGRLSDYGGSEIAFHPVEPLLAVVARRELRIFRYGDGLKRAATATLDGSPLELAFGPNRSLWVAVGAHADRPPRVVRYTMGDPP